MWQCLGHERHGLSTGWTSPKEIRNFNAVPVSIPSWKLERREGDDPSSFMTAVHTLHQEIGKYRETRDD